MIELQSRIERVKFLLTWLQVCEFFKQLDRGVIQVLGDHNIELSYMITLAVDALPMEGVIEPRTLDTLQLDCFGARDSVDGDITPQDCFCQSDIVL